MKNNDFPIPENAVAVFEGEMLGLVLQKRSETDNHVVFKLCTVIRYESKALEDADWFPVKNPLFSSYWIQDFMNVLKQAEDWLKENGVAEEDGYGWKFKT